MKFKNDFFDSNDYETSSILLELSNPVIFSSSSSVLKWGRTKKRTLLIPPLLLKSSPVGEMLSTSSSSCLTGEAKKTHNFPIEEEMGLLRAQVGLRTQPIKEDENLRHLEPLICVDRTANVKDVETTSLRARGFDLNLPAVEEGSVEGFERMASKKVQAAAQARQRRLGLIRSKKLYQRFISLHQFK